jgi:hypothetical protein
MSVVPRPASEDAVIKYAFASPGLQCRFMSTPLPGEMVEYTMILYVLKKSILYYTTSSESSVSSPASPTVSK